MQILFDGILDKGKESATPIPRMVRSAMQGSKAPAIFLFAQAQHGFEARQRGIHGQLLLPCENIRPT